VADEWFYARDGQQTGPFSLGQLKSFVTIGRLKRSDHIWTEGMAEWLPAGQVPQLYPAGHLPVKPSVTPKPSASSSTPIRPPSTPQTPPAAATTVNPPTDLGRWFSRLPNQQEVALVVAGSFLLCIVICCGSLIDWSGGHEVDPIAFKDNPQRFKGQIITLHHIQNPYEWSLSLRQKGSSYLAKSEQLSDLYDGKRPKELPKTFKQRFEHWKGAQFSIEVDIPLNLELPALSGTEQARITFRCTKGSLGDGNELVSIQRE
jgi:hypothetical protein